MEKNITEIKKEYTNFLLDMLTPLLYEGIASIYDNCINQHEQLLKKNKYSNKASPGILKIFQLHLKEIPSLNTHKIETETNRIKEASKCSSFFDELVKAIVKSNIILLSPAEYDDYHKKIVTSDFIHKCYIECAKNFYNNPHLFWHEYSSIQIKKNQKHIFKIIRKSIKNAIRKLLPLKYILDEYLNADYKDVEYERIRESVLQILEDEKYLNIDNESSHKTIKIQKLDAEEYQPTVQQEQKVLEEVAVPRGIPHIEDDKEFNEALKDLGNKNIILDLNNVPNKKRSGEKEAFFAQYM